MDLYIVTGPFHAFCAACLQLQENKGRDGMICILDRFEGAEKMADNIKHSGVFAETYLMPKAEVSELSPSNRITKRIKRGLLCRMLRARYQAYKGTPLYGRRF